MNTGVSIVLLSTVADRRGWYFQLLNAREADGVTPVIPHEYCMTNVCTYCSRTSSARAIAERAMAIAAGLCVYTNTNFIYESIAL